MAAAGSWRLEQQLNGAAQRPDLLAPMDAIIHQTKCDMRDIGSREAPGSFLTMDRSGPAAKNQSLARPHPALCHMQKKKKKKKEKKEKKRKEKKREKEKRLQHRRMHYALALQLLFDESPTDDVLLLDTAAVHVTAIRALSPLVAGYLHPCAIAGDATSRVMTTVTIHMHAALRG